MITVIISTSNRLHYLKRTLSDLINLNEIIDKIIIFSFNDLKSENYIKSKFNKIFKKIITIKSRNNFEFENRIRNLSTFQTKLIYQSQYLWFMSDKDRVLSKKFNHIKMILKRNIGGLTMNVHSLKKPYNLKVENKKIDLFNLEKGIHKLGLISSQILNKRLFLKYSKQTEVSAYYLSEIILKIIINEKNWFFCRQKVIGYTHLNKDKNRDKLNLKYLSYRMEQEFDFYIFKLDKFLSKSKYTNKDKIIYKAFFKNVISWLVLLKEKENKINFSKKIISLHKRIVDYKIIRMLLLLTIFTPIFAINFLKKIKKILRN